MNKSKKQAFNHLKPMLENIAAGIAKQFGNNCEVAIHNLTDGYKSTIEIIENGHVTGRKVRDSASEIVLEALKDKTINDRYGYITYSNDGRMLKSSTINIRDDDGDVIAVISINYDISNLTLANKIINEFVEFGPSPEEKNGEKITNNVTDLLEQLIEESRGYIGKSVSAMSKDEKVDAIRYLNRKGALLIKKSADRIAEFYGISRYTLYRALGDQEES
jgi:predicted transcriptional regulator YheO